MTSKIDAVVDTMLKIVVYSEQLMLHIHTDYQMNFLVKLAKGGLDTSLSKL